MTTSPPPGRTIGFTIGLAAVLVTATALIAAWMSGVGPGPSEATGRPSSSPVVSSPPPSTPVVSTPGAASIAPSAPVEAVDCRPDPGPLPSYLADPCPSAILAVELAVATVRLPIKEIVLEPGPLYCTVIWEGLGSPPICYGPMTRAGQYMHAYVSFVGSKKVAVVMLGLDLPVDDVAPDATRPPWNTTVVTVAIPPSGWVMP